ncbi:MAG TPA: DegV family protein [Candidatus Merdenecus merdavium]|nr:DegV family protein [Candidatus Merdenecus merdavium]
MREFIISTESNADLPEEFIDCNHILVIPHYYSIEEKIYGDGEELTTHEFYEEMRNKKKVATMASNPAVILDKFKQCAKEGKDILHISFSSSLSAGYSNIVMGAREIMEEYPQMSIRVIDTLSASFGEMLMILKAIECQSKGMTLNETADEIETLVPHICIQCTVDDLNHLYRGGRLSRTTAILGTIAAVKPILFVDQEGKLAVLDKVRGRKKSFMALIDHMEKRLGSFKDHQIAVGIVHGDCEEDAVYVKELIYKKFGYDHIMIRPIGPSIGAHSGPGTIGVVYLGESR